MGLHFIHFLLWLRAMIIDVLYIQQYYDILLKLEMAIIAVFYSGTSHNGPSHERTTSL